MHLYLVNQLVQKLVVQEKYRSLSSIAYQSVGRRES